MFTVSLNFSFGSKVKAFDNQGTAVKESKAAGLWSYAHSKVRDAAGVVVWTTMGTYSRAGNWKIENGEVVTDTSPDPMPWMA